ncbi:hypothetical protein B0H34DRAFT_857485 [Crassisporium funariophilum]|nr:hypothetical protein B0H34DRAFT_857485 [Crassisporium funariophilum]
MPKATTRGTGGGGQLRSHSRSSSTTKLGANLQFTQKDLSSTKVADKPKKLGYAYEAHPTKTAPPFARVNSSQRVHSKEQLAQPTKRLLPPIPPQQQQQRPPVNGKAKAGFTLASPSENADDDEDWVSSESGAATPNKQDSDSSDTASEADDPRHALTQAQPPAAGHPVQADFIVKPPADAILARVPTARPSDFEPPARLERNTPKPVTPPPRQGPSQPSMQPPQATHNQNTARVQAAPAEPHTTKESGGHTSQTKTSPKISSKRTSRPPSTHSICSRGEHALRPHPLIRGQSYGNVHPPPKPAPLAPLTVIPSAGLPQISTSPPSSVHYLSSSPTTSVKTSGSPTISNDLPPSFLQDRRTSFSSARSVNTIPVHSTLIREAPQRTHDRNRTISTMSTQSSSAALSSLAHLPTVTRPPSPQSLSYFPPVNPHANIEGIHPLLPGPYLHNHLTVLARRTPIRESFDRVIRAKHARLAQ